MRVAVFNVMLSRPSDVVVTVNYTTVPKTAVAPSDFTELAGTLYFAPGQIAAQIVIPVRDDIPGSSAEEFDVMISGAVAASVKDGTGACILPAIQVYTQPYISIDNPWVASS